MSVSTALEGIAKKAKRNGAHQFVNLYRLLNEESLHMAWKELNKRAAAGIDKVTAGEYAQDLDKNIEELVKRLKEKRYRATPIRRQYIPKSNGKMRPLGIPVLEDRLVQRATVMILEAIYEQDFLPVSHGYRWGKSAKGCVKELRDELQFGGYRYVVEADIKGFFDHLDHDWLMKMLAHRINDRSLLRLIKKWLIVGVLEPEGMTIHPKTGTPQGGIISPILANIYLHYALDLWVMRPFRNHCHEEVKYVRYADDFVCAFASKMDAERFYEELPVRLAKFNLSLAEDKTRILKSGWCWGKMAQAFDFLGFTLKWEKDRKGHPYLRRKTSRKKLEQGAREMKEFIKAHRSLKLPKLIEKVNAKLRGHYEYFGVIGNSRSIQEFARITTNLLFKWLNRRSQKRSFNWRTFETAIKRLGLLRPRITEQKDNQLKLPFPPLSRVRKRI